jgi:putative transposase
MIGHLAPGETALVAALGSSAADAINDRVYRSAALACAMDEAIYRVLGGFCSLAGHKHLRRLGSVWIESPIYFLTICVAARRRVLANHRALGILRAEFEAAPERYGWMVGQFVVMPDHLHFFCASDHRPTTASLSRFIGGFKQWTAKGILRAAGLPPPLWQKQFFDHERKLRIEMAIRLRESRAGWTG